MTTSSGPAFPVSRSLLFTVLATLAVRLLVVAFVYPSFLVPEHDHWEFAYEGGKIAESLVHGSGFANPYYGGPTGPTAELAPVLPYILAGIFWLFGIYTKASAIAFLSLNSLISALTCIPVFFIAKITLGLREARWAAWTWAFFPYAINFSADSMWDHALLALLVSCIILTVLHLQYSSRLWSWMGFGLLIGFTALTNPVVLGIVPFVTLWACYQLYKKQQAWLMPAASAALISCLVIGPWLLRNYETFHRPVFLKDGLPLAFADGNFGNALHWNSEVTDPCGNSAEMAEFHRVGEVAYMSEKAQLAKDFLKHNPGLVARRSFRRFLYMWTGYWSFNREYLKIEPFDPYNIPLCTAFTILMLLGLRKLFQRDANVALLYTLVLLVFPLVYYFTICELGYRQPIDPEVVILACFAVTSWRSASPKVA